jgi:hypothetical protein
MLATKSSSLKTAAAAEISTRTFFGYFASKEGPALPRQPGTSPGGTGRHRPAPARRPPGRGAAARTGARGRERRGHDQPLASVRVRLIQTVPSVQGRGLQVLFSAQRDIARHLLAAFPSELDAISSAALVGALADSISATIAVLVQDPARSQEPDRMRAEIGRAAQITLQPWLTTRDR